MSALFSTPDMPTATAESQMPSRTAERIEDPERKRKNKLAGASIMTRDWNKPKLGTPGMSYKRFIISLS